LEQNKARVTTASAGDDDESLEQAFRDATTGDNSTAPTPVIERKKKTREDFIRELKEKREKDGLAAEKKEIDIEEAKKAGKFRPIGFKPVGSQTSEEKGTKKRKKERDGEKKQKKRKVQSESQPIPADAPPLEQPKEDVPPPPVSNQEQDPEPDLDIFADAEEYTGLQIDEDEDDEETNNKEPEPEVSSAPKQNWFDEPEEPSPLPAPAPTKKLVEEDEEEEQPPMRLIPLASSSVPSVKDILAMDQEAQKAEKRKARKEKRKEKKELTAEGKANRDYQKYVHQNYVIIISCSRICNSRLMAFEKKKEK
jgi:IK cytokine